MTKPRALDFGQDQRLGNSLRVMRTRDGFTILNQRGRVACFPQFKYYKRGKSVSVSSFKGLGLKGIRRVISGSSQMMVFYYYYYFFFSLNLNFLIDLLFFPCSIFD